MKRMVVMVFWFGLTSVSWGAVTKDVPFSSSDLPAGCKVVPGLYPVGIRTSMLYDYKRYAGAMPPLVFKTAQSLSCDNQKGSLYYFEYADADQRDQAELFARPILSREEDLPHPIEVVEWPKGFLVVSFKDPPSMLLDALNQKVKPMIATTSSAIPKGTSILASVPPPLMAISAPPSTTTSLPKISPAVVAVPVVVANPNMAAPTTAVASLPIATSDGEILTDSRGINQMMSPKPAAPLSDEPPMDSNHSLKVSAPPPLPKPAIEPSKPVVVAKKPVIALAVNAADLPTPAEPSTKPAVMAPVNPIQATPALPSVTVVSKPITPVVAPPQVIPLVNLATRPLASFAGVHGLNDVSPAVLTAFAGKLDCANPDIKEQGRIVCSVLNDFQQGTKPDMPSNTSTILLGPVYTVDEYGRLIDMHYDVLAGSEQPSLVSFFAVVSNGGREDFELQSMIDARKTHQALSSTPTLTRIQQVIAKKKIPVVATLGSSALILPGGPRRLYVRKSGDHWVMVGPSGASSDEQSRGSFVLATLY